MPGRSSSGLAPRRALLLLLAGRPTAADAAAAATDGPGQAELAGQVSVNGRAYTNAPLGITIRVPAALQGWTLGRHMVELGMKGALDRFQTQEETESNQDGLKIRDVAFTAVVQGRKVKGTLRTLARGLDLVFLTAMGPAETWGRDQETALKIINTFHYARPKTP